MNIPNIINIEILSDTCFGAGHGTGSLVDVEIDHNEIRLPRISGRVIHGLLRDTWLSMHEHFPHLQKSAERILGVEGDLEETSILAVSDATAPRDVIDWVRYAQERPESKVTKDLLLGSITTIRRQTAINRETGSASEGSLRSIRVLLRGFNLISQLVWLEKPTPEDLSVLAICLLGTRHAGNSRTRGLGHVLLTLDGDHALTKEVALKGGSSL